MTAGALSPLLLLAKARAAGVATCDAAGTVTYEQLLARSESLARALLARRAGGAGGGPATLGGERVAFLVPGDRWWPVVLWGIWRAGGLAVPLCTSHPARELAYVLRDAEPAAVIGGGEHAPLLGGVAREFGLECASAEELLRDTPGARGKAAPLPAVRAGDPALIVYTSGSTGGPKGVVLSHRNLAAQVASLHEAWRWSAADWILNVLPLHHVHGIVNVVCCALAAGARCELMPRFDERAVWQRFAGGELTLFMAVPTIYTKLVAAHQALARDERAAGAAGARRLRLMVSGSAALPASLFEAWQTATGQVLLERYGMTETGMVLSNPLDGPRVAGEVGGPLPGVEVRLANGGEPCDGGREGELLVRGGGVFGGYWRRPEATAAAFRDDWFVTGDVAREHHGRYRLLGRSSVDILKTGGYKVSALEIEEVLRDHPAIWECAVVGLPDPTWGERVTAVVVLREGARLELARLREWTKERLAPYKAPRELRVVATLPRNALGKVVKPELKRLLGG